ncbi:hypothetical protein U1Q18_005698, partial [Sarracenia purpurea var. burkii]
MMMEVVIPTMDFDFNSQHPSSYSSAPSTPKRFGDYYCSAPTSPTNLSDFYGDFDDFFVSTTPSPIPESSNPIVRNEDDFAFDVTEESEKTVLPAEELFDGGRIRPLNPPQQKRSRLGASEARKSPSISPISHIRGVLSPKKKKKEAGSFENSHKKAENERGRERNPSLSSSNSGRRGTRSLSPYRVSKYPWEDEQNLQQSTKQSSIVLKPSTPSTSAPCSSSSKGSTRKWRLKDFFLFRSASEGRATDKDPLKKYTGLFWKHEDAKSSSFRSIEGSSSRRRGGPAISAHELHYTVNRAVSEDLKKKTFLPYKQGILGRLAFNPAVHALANGFGFSR